MQPLHIEGGWCVRAILQRTQNAMDGRMRPLATAELPPLNPHTPPQRLAFLMTSVRVCVCVQQRLAGRIDSPASTPLHCNMP